MKKITLSICAAAIFAGSPITQAAEFNYNFADVGIGQYTPTVAGNAGTGYNLAGSYGVAKNVNLVGSYDSVTLSGIGTSNLLAGAGYHMPIGDSADLIGEILYRKTSAGSNDWNGYNANIGAQFKVSDKVALRATFGQTSVSGTTSKSGSIYDIAALYQVNDKMGINVSYHSDPDATGWNILRIAARFNF